MTNNIRQLLAIPFMIVALALFAFGIFEFGKALFTWNSTDLIIGVAVMVFAFIFMFITRLIMPSAAKLAAAKAATDAATPDAPAKKSLTYVLVIPADPAAPLRTLHLEPSLTALAEALGGYPAPISGGKDWQALTDNGPAAHPYNARATHVLTFMADRKDEPVMGDVAFIGINHSKQSALPFRVSAQVNKLASEVIN